VRRGGLKYAPGCSRYRSRTNLPIPLAEFKLFLLIEQWEAPILVKRSPVRLSFGQINAVAAAAPRGTD
jgi:hypothetical protein